MTRRRVRLIAAGAVVGIVGGAAGYGIAAGLPPWAVAVAAWIALEIAAWPVVRRRHVADGVRAVLGAARSGLSPLPVRFHPFAHFVPEANGPVDGVNKHGFRSAGPTDRPLGLRVYLAGDCTSFDGHLIARDTFVRQFEALLAREAPGVEVVNAGCLHYTSVHSLCRFMLDSAVYRLNVALMMVGINDVLPFVHTGGDPGPNYSAFYRSTANLVPVRATLPGRYPVLFSMLPLFRLYAYWRLREYLPERWDERALVVDDDYRSVDNVRRCYDRFHTGYLQQALHSFIDLARSRDIRPVLVTNHYNKADMTGPVREFYAYGIDKANETIRHLAHQRSATLFDLAREFPNRAGLVTNKWHFTAEGNAERARLFHQFLESEGMFGVQLSTAADAARPLAGPPLL